MKETEGSDAEKKVSHIMEEHMAGETEGEGGKTAKDRPLTDIRQESLQVKETWQVKDKEQTRRQL